MQKGTQCFLESVAFFCTNFPIHPEDKVIAPSAPTYLRGLPEVLRFAQARKCNNKYGSLCSHWHLRHYNWNFDISIKMVRFAHVINSNSFASLVSARIRIKTRSYLLV